MTAFVPDGYLLIRSLAWQLEKAREQLVAAEKKRDVYAQKIASQRIQVIELVTPFAADRQVVTVAQHRALIALTTEVYECTYDYMRSRMTMELINVVMQMRCKRCVA